MSIQSIRSLLVKVSPNRTASVAAAAAGTPAAALSAPLGSASLLRSLSSASSAAALDPNRSLTLPDLPYDYSDLEPFISGDIMKLHHQKHHQAYVTNFNASYEQYLDAEAKKDVAKMIALQPAIRFNGGGHVNHSIFWKNLINPKKGGGGRPGGDLAKAIDRDFGSFDKFQAKMTAAAVGVQGSGWAWLGYHKDAGRLELATCANQDPLTALVPLLGVDVWEHAYYLQYKNVRADYVKQIWGIVNWRDVSERFDAARK